MTDYMKNSIGKLKRVLESYNRKIEKRIKPKAVVEISRREAECSRLFSAAQESYEKKGDNQLAIMLFSRVKKELPESHWAINAENSIVRIIAGAKRIPFESNESKTNMRFQFTGTAKEYFKIWIVNLCLTLVTVGVFSAWAKVRKKRFIYSHLNIDGSQLQYLAKPVPILKGRIMAAIIFLAYYSSRNFFYDLFPYVLVVAMFLAPWVFVQSIRFNCRYCAYRNLTFQFEGKYFQAFKVLSAFGIIPAFVFAFFFKFWGKNWIFWVIALAFGLYFPLWMKDIKKFIVKHTSFGGKSGRFGATGKSFFATYLTSALILFLFFFIAGIAMAILPGVVTHFQDQAIFAYAFMLPIYIGYVFSLANIKANITNKVWNNINLGPVFFHCSLGTFDLVKLYLTNALGIIASAGFLIPWAVIRTLKYRIEHTQIFSIGELTDFKGSQKINVKATGAELMEFFDMDLSL